MPNAFIVKAHAPRLNNIKYDQYYIERWLKDKVVKTGEGEEDFSIVKVVVEDKKSIKEVIDAQANDVGLDNILKKFALTGDESILPESAVIPPDAGINDFSAMPDDLIDAHNLFKAQKEVFNNLPAEITKGRNFDDFMSSFTQAEFDAYSRALKEKLKPAKKVDEKGEDK